MRLAVRARALIALAKLVTLIALLASSRGAAAQVAPNLDWRTITTTHFYVHFTPPVEGLARRIAADAERAYGQLAAQLHPPRGMIDVVVSDDADVSNGSATPFPTNRIVVYANPPVSESALRYTNDWGQLVITHELTHIFHLDRARGLWDVGQHVFGRAAALFPNLYSPSWITEGVAVYEESRLAGAGRIEGSEHRMIARAAAIDHRFPSIGALSLSYGRYPFGEQAYGYGSLFIDYMAHTYGDSAVRRFVDKSAADIIPYLPDVPAKQAFGVSFSRAFRAFRDSIERTVPTQLTVGGDWRQLTQDGVYVLAPRWTGDSALLYTGTPGRESFAAYRVTLDGKRQNIGRRNSRSPNVVLGPNTYLYAQLELTNPYQERSDLWIEKNGRAQQITFGERLTSPDARNDGQIVAEQITPGATRLVRVSPDGRTLRPITGGSYDEQWTEPRWSHRGDRIAAVRWLRGNLSQIVVLDSAGKELAIVASARSIQATPSWAWDDSGIYYSSDITGSAEVYLSRFGDANRAGAGARDGGRAAPVTTYRISNTPTGLFEPQASPAGDRLASVLFRSDGYHLGVQACCDATRLAWTLSPFPNTFAQDAAAPLVVDNSPARPFSPWRTLLPRYWIPTLDNGILGGYRLGAQTSGYDVIGRHKFTAALQVPTNNTGITGQFSYQYAGLGLPILATDLSQDWSWLGSAFARSGQRPDVGEVLRGTTSADVLATWLRSRVRTLVSVSGGVGLERRTHTTTTGIPIASIDTSGALGTIVYPTLIAGAGFANYQRPAFSISPEDGVQANLTLRDRLRSGATGRAGESMSAVASVAGYKSLDLPGFAHHVLALRGSGGIADANAAGYFSIGGVSGSSYQIIPGYVIGEGRRTFPVRGFDAGTLVGTRALTGSAEYRIPLVLTSGGPGILPFFIDRSSLTVFGDYGTAWCPSITAGAEVCAQPNPVLTGRLDIASVGAELSINLGVLSWDTPYQFRIGVAHPTQNAVYFGRNNVQGYLVGGLSF